jgi:hypothetical protein
MRVLRNGRVLFEVDQSGFRASGSPDRYAVVVALVCVNASAETALAVFFDRQSGILKLQSN